jgi:hypothetical protein
MPNKLTRQEALARLDQERDFQDDNAKAKNFGDRHSPAEFLALLQAYQQDAFLAYRGSSGNDQLLAIIRKIGGLAVACIEEHGCPERVNVYRTKA